MPVTPSGDGRQGLYVAGGYWVGLGTDEINVPKKKKKRGDRQSLDSTIDTHPYTQPPSGPYPQVHVDIYSMEGLREGKKDSVDLGVQD